jgi:hypothetical protein
MSQTLLARLDKVYCCKVCERIFLFESDLVSHLRRDGHRGEFVFSWTGFFGKND